MTDYAQAVRTVLDRIAAAERRYGRVPGSVRLLAVSKGHSADDIRTAASAGQRLFGESYLQEALPKLEALADQNIEWHFIGPIQSNKTRGIAEHFSWVHGVDRLKIAERLNAQRPESAGLLNTCIEVKLGTEPGKSGVPPPEVSSLVHEVSRLPRLRVRGLMTIPPASHDFEIQRRFFRQLKGLYTELARDNPAFDTLSMGMTEDLEAAIAEGATIVRVGSGIFGARPD
jgi:pyridoxal phosphate enzyme (YggS family)